MTAIIKQLRTELQPGHNQLDITSETLAAIMQKWNARNVTEINANPYLQQVAEQLEPHRGTLIQAGRKQQGTLQNNYSMLRNGIKKWLAGDLELTNNASLFGNRSVLVRQPLVHAVEYADLKARNERLNTGIAISGVITTTAAFRLPSTNDFASTLTVAVGCAVAGFSLFVSRLNNSERLETSQTNNLPADLAILQSATGNAARQ